MSGNARIGNSSVVVVHPTGNANVRNLLTGLAQKQLLAEYHTTIAVFGSGFGAAVARLPGLSAFGRRRYPELLRPMTKTHPWRECLRNLSLKTRWMWPVENEKGCASIDAVIRSLDRTASKRLRRIGANAIYAFEDGALECFLAARTLGMKCVYEHPVGYWRKVQRLMREEVELKPEWAATMRGLADSEEKLARKDAELASADSIIVASSFSRESLNEYPGSLPPIKIVPYGAPSAFDLRDSGALHKSGPLKVLFVGGLGQMKGLSYMFRAVEMLGKEVALTVIGRKPFAGVPALERALKMARWIDSLPHHEILHQMATHDVLVFPSLSEGFGMVVTEALSQGLPVITTPHTCGPDVLTEGKDGFVVPIRDSQAIAEKLELLHRDRDRLAAMSEAASKKAKTLTWECYRRGVVEAVREALASALA